MKKGCIAVLVFCISLVTAGTALAAGQAARNTGCGLGTMLWGNKADGSVFSQSLQATTNGTFGNQTFGITSGTLGCEQPTKVAANKRLMEFTTNNLDNLARDMARGHGESLATLAELMAVTPAQRPAFYATLQSHFGDIFTDGNVTSAAVLDRIATATN